MNRLNTFKRPGKIDCFLIGHYEVECEKLVDRIEGKIIKSQNPRFFQLNYLNYNTKPYYAPGLLNLFCNREYPGDADFFNYWRGVINNTIGYLGSYLHRRGFTFDYINSFQDQKVELARKLQQDEILLVAVTTTYYVNYIAVLEIIKFIRKHNRSARIVVGGPLISNQVAGLDSPEKLNAFFGVMGADIYVNSIEGEATLVNLLHALKNNKPLDQINNLFYKKGQTFIATSPREEGNKLSENLVDWSLFTREQPEYVNIRTSISCPFKCSFCGFPHRAGKYQRLNPEKIIEELDSLSSVKSVKTVNFIDDTFNVPAAGYKKLLRRMIKKNYPFKWISFLRCDKLDNEMAQLMKESGCLGVFLGIESANNQMLKNMNKGITVETYYKKISLLKKHDLLVYGSFIIGFPGETGQTVADSIKFIEESGIDFYSGKLWFMEPVSGIMKEKEKYGIKGLMYEWVHNTMNYTRAIEINEQITMEIKNAAYVPDYQFSFWWALHMLNKGLKFDTLKSFLRSFVQGLTEKLKGHPKSNMSPGVTEAIRKLSIAAYKEINSNNDNKPPAIECTSDSIDRSPDEQSHVIAEFDL